MPNETRQQKEYVGFNYKEKTYYFAVHNDLKKDSMAKRVLIGCFPSLADSAHKNETLPDGVEFDKLYCLKQASVSLPFNDFSYPQDRHFWDFFPFKGDNLREIVALNDDALKMSELLRNGELNPFSYGDKQSFRCAVLEPVYTPFNAEDFPSFKEKLDCMLQIVNGVKELMAENTLRRFKIVAHRDLKFNNVVVEKRQDGTRRLRLIDFPTVKFSSRDGDVEENFTYPGFLSPSNTAPEDVMRRYSVTSKTDVFALGTMLAEIFEVWNYKESKNPLALLFELADFVNNKSARECAEFYKNLNDDIPFGGYGERGWIEVILDRHNKNGDWGDVMRICPEIRELFRMATPINPQNRISLTRFEMELRSIMHELNQNEGFVVRNPYNERVTYILIDTSDIDNYRNQYCVEIDKVLSIIPDTLASLLHYESCHASSKSLEPDMGPLALNSVDKNSIIKEVMSLTSTGYGPMNVSKLKGCLYELAAYLSNESVRRRFNGEIHIFAPVVPNEQNTLGFQMARIGVGGVPEMKDMSLKDICAMISVEGLKVYVHTFRSEETAEDWYETVYFNEEPQKATESVKENADGNGVVVKGRGACFIGGLPVKRN